jgi:hypothetical protein
MLASFDLGNPGGASALDPRFRFFGMMLLLSSIVFIDNPESVSGTAC